MSSDSVIAFDPYWPKLRDEFLEQNPTFKAVDSKGKPSPLNIWWLNGRSSLRSALDEYLFAQGIYLFRENKQFFLRFFDEQQMTLFVLKYS